MKFYFIRNYKIMTIKAFNAQQENEIRTINNY